MKKSIVIKNHIISRDKLSVCIPVMSKTDDAIIEEINEDISKGAYFIEFRADYYEKLADIDSLLTLLSKIKSICKDTILLFTIRTQSEGGLCDLDDVTLKEIYLAVAKSHFVDIIDIEIFSLNDSYSIMAEIQNTGVYVIASNHNFAETFDDEELYNRYEKMYQAKADILKIAMMPNSKQDVLRVLSVVDKFTEEHEDALLVGISMGKFGKISRIFGGVYGSCMSFSAIKKASAPGQIGFDDMQTILKIIE